MFYLPNPLSSSAHCIDLCKVCSIVLYAKHFSTVNCAISSSCGLNTEPDPRTGQLHFFPGPDCRPCTPNTSSFHSQTKSTTHPNLCLSRSLDAFQNTAISNCNAILMLLTSYVAGLCKFKEQRVEKRRCSTLELLK